jgi:hypothetical protein
VYEDDTRVPAQSADAWSEPRTVPEESNTEASANLVQSNAGAYAGSAATTPTSPSAYAIAYGSYSNQPATGQQVDRDDGSNINRIIRKG